MVTRKARDTRGSRADRRLRGLLAPVVLLLTLGGPILGGCGADRRPGERISVGPFPDAPVVLISVDTLRSDRLPAYGYEAVETPRIEELRRDAILFERAYANYPLTLPSHASIFSGRLPSEHGVRDNVGYAVETGPSYLPRWLRDRGWPTGAAVSTWILREETGIGDGFSFYDDSVVLAPGASLGAGQRPGGETVDRALEWLEEREAGSRYFLFLHLYEPHAPWDPPEPFRSRVPDPYDGEVAASDALVGRLLDALKDRGDYERAIVLFLSDHGEGLGDHGEEEHGIFLYREALQVPLLVKLPGNRLSGTRVPTPAQLTDVAPTVRALVGDDAATGPTLLDLMEPEPPERTLYAETYYPRIHLGWSDLASLIDGDLHYIEGPDPELYDLASDPGETRNILRQRRGEYARLRDAMPPFRSALETPAEADAETAERLASLGYLAGRAGPEEGPLPSPRERLPGLHRLKRGVELTARGEWSQAVRILGPLVEESPRMADGWENLAVALENLGRLREAETAYRRALELTGGADHVALRAAGFFLVTGRTDEAREHAELALPTSPARAHGLLARIALAEDEIDEAERHARAALENEPEAPGPRLALARIAAARDRLEEALELLSEVETENGDAVPDLSFVRGDVLARLGRTEEATRSFRRAMEANPADPRPYTRLAILQALDGRPREAVGLLRRLVEENETPAAYAAAVETLRLLGDREGARRLLEVARSRFPESSRLAEMGS